MGADSLQYTIGKFAAPVTVFLSTWVPPMGVFGIILAFAGISIVLYMALFKMYTKEKKALKPN